MFHSVRELRRALAVGVSTVSLAAAGLAAIVTQPASAAVMPVSIAAVSPAAVTGGGLPAAMPDNGLPSNGLIGPAGFVLN